jgi:RecA/RadA recombinase
MKNKEIINMLKNKKKTRSSEYLSTGSTLLNLACAGKLEGGFETGDYCYFVGDTTSGKTFLTLSCLAEASINPKFANHRLIHDDVEGGAKMDIVKFFGQKIYDRMEPPGGYDENKIPIFSSSIEEFYYHIDDAIKKGKPFIYILDSMDGLSSVAEIEKFEESKNAYRKGKTTTGSFGDGKAKKNSTNLRQLLTPLKRLNSILIIISQTRDNLGFGFAKKIRSGGHALSFYATLEIWSSVAGDIKKKIKGKDRQLGTFCKIRVKKNRQTGRKREITIPIYHSFGIDDIGSCVDFLVEEHWTKKGSFILAKELALKLPREKLIQKIEENGLERKIRLLVGKVWQDIEKECTIKRKSRY